MLEWTRRMSYFTNQVFKLCWGKASLWHWNPWWWAKRKKIIRATKEQEEVTYGKIGRKLSTNNTVGTVTAHHLSPNHSELRTRHSLGGLVDVSDFLSEVKLTALLVINTINLQQRSVVVSITASSLVTQNGSLDIQSGGLSNKKLDTGKDLSVEIITWLAVEVALVISSSSNV